MTSTPATHQPNDAIIDEDTLDFAGTLPKSEIQAIDFIKKHPEYDGRGCTIAIFDTGVDPGASGLSTTPHGAPKIVDVVDCTGSGDVDTSKIVKADDPNDPTTIQGIYEGSILHINENWKNPTGEWHVGAKPIFDLFPGPLKSRIKEVRKRKWSAKQRQAITSATSALAQHAKAHGSATPSDDLLKKEREELEARLKLLEEMTFDENVGPVVHCVVWHDGDMWQAALDTSELYEEYNNIGTGSDDNDSNDTTTATNTNNNNKVKGGNNNRGSLADFIPMTNFRTARQYATFSPEDSCNYAINIYDNGNILSVVVDAGSHGTHVAGIAAAHHPEDPSLNGVAPGAQIVSCKIGDTRLGSMETMVGLTRALIAVLENKCDIINMSYGEATSTANIGRFIKLAEEIVHKHNVIYVASAGNAGQALSTVGAPGGTSSAILGIGAFVSPDMARAAHSVRKSAITESQALGAQYTWSSRGPTSDGDIGVGFSAPGGAIAPVPQWTSQKKQLMNGTSMASPCACGGLSLLISALKADGHVITPARIRRAVENTAVTIDPENPASVLTYGRGLLQVMDAYDYLMKGEGSLLDGKELGAMRFDIRVKRTDSSVAGRGIYIRQPAECLRPLTYIVEIKPELPEDSDVRSARLEVDLKLSVQTTQPWVVAPEMLMLHHNGRAFEVEVDATQLPEGLHYAEIVGVDSTAEWRGALFRVPVTVVKPLILSSQPGRLMLSPLSSSNSNDNNSNNSTTTTTLLPATNSVSVLDLFEHQFDPGHEMRRFIAVPEGSTWAELKLSMIDGDTPKNLFVRSTAILPHTRYSDTEYRATIQITPPRGETISAFKVIPGSTIEISIAQAWSSIGSAIFKASLSFHGVEASVADAGRHVDASSSSFVVNGGSGPLKVYVRAPLAREKIKPTAKLDVVQISLRPQPDVELIPLNEPRDTLPDGRTIHRLVLTYKLSLQEGGKITPRVPLFNRYVYDCEIESQMSFLMDENNQVLAINDIYPDGITLKKGEYTILLSLRHEDPSLLESMKSLPIVVERKLDTAITVPIYPSNTDVIKGTHAITSDRFLCPGERIAFFIGNVADDALPKDATAGRVLLGRCRFGQTSIGKDAPGSIPLVYIVPPKKIEASSSSSGSGGGSSKKTTTTNASATTTESNNNDTTTTNTTTTTDTTTTTVKTPHDELKEALRDAEVKFLQSMKTDTDEKKAAFESMLSDLKSRFPDHLPVLRQQLKYRVSCSTSSNSTTTDDDSIDAFKAVVVAADELLQAIDTTELAVYIARKCPEEGEDGAKRKKEMDERKSAVIEALTAKCTALLDIEEKKESSTTNSSSLFDDAFSELRRWVDPAGSDAAHALLLSRRERRAGRYALALKALDKAAHPEDKPTPKDVMKMRISLFEQLGWNHWADAEGKKMRKAFPPHSRPTI